MALTIESRPTKVFNSQTSAWNVVATPIVYKLKRKDYAVHTVSNNGGNAQIKITGDITAQISPGDTVYFKGDANYDVFCTTGADSYSAPDTTINLNTPYNGTTTNMFINIMKRDYIVEVVLNVNGTDTGIFNYSPNKYGDVHLDVSHIISNYVSADNTTDYPNSIEWVHDIRVAKNFYLKYKEIWTGSSTVQQSDSANTIYAVHASRQINESAYSGNLADYVVFASTASSSVLGGKILTKFTSAGFPSAFPYWRGYPMSLCHIRNPNGGTGAIYRSQVEQRDQASLIISTDRSSTLAVVDNGIWRDKFTKWLTVASNAKTLIYTVGEWVAGSIYYEATQALVMEVRDPCPNPIYLYWRNSLGGDSWWLFDVSHDYEYEYRGQIRRRLTLYAENVRTDQWHALNELNSIGEIYKQVITELTTSINKTHVRRGSQVYMMDTAGNKTGVIVIPTNNSISLRGNKHSFECTIELPEYLRA